MNIRELAKYAQEHKACKPGLKQILESASESELIQLYKDNIDFCLSENFPSNEYLSEKVSDTILIKHGIFLDDEALIKNREFIVLLGKCFACIEINGYNVCQIYAKSSASIDVAAKDNSFVVIDAFDNALVRIEATGESKVLVNLYGNATVSHKQKDNSIIRVIHKNKESY